MPASIEQPRNAGTFAEFEDVGISVVWTAVQGQLREQHSDRKRYSLASSQSLISRSSCENSEKWQNIF